MDKKVFYYFYSAIFIITPSLMFTNLVEVFELPKMFFLSALFIIFALYSATKLKYVQVNFLDLFIVVFLLFYFISSLLSPFPFVSFFGLPYVYSESFIYILSLFLFLFFTKEGFKYINQSTILNLVILGSIPVLLYSFIQAIGLDPVDWFDRTNRVFSTFGQPNLLGLYYGVCLLSALWFFLEENIRKYLLLIVVYLTTIFLTLGLGTILSLVFTLLVLFILRYKHLHRRSLAVFGGISLIIILAFSIPLFSRVLYQLNGGSFNGVYKTEDTAKVRLILYKSTIEQFIEDPKIFGNGPENYLFIYQRSGDLNDTSLWKTDFTKPHNFFIEELFEIGLIGLIFYLFVYLTSLYYTRNNYIFILPVFILTCSLFFWPGVFNYFLMLFLFYFGMVDSGTQFSKSIRINLIKKMKFPILIILTIIFIINTTWFVSVVLLKNNPCVALQFFYSSEYQLSCFEQNSKTPNTLLDYNSKYYNYRYANILLEERNTKCEKVYKRLLEDNNPKYFYGYGQCLEMLGDKEGALNYYTKALYGNTDFYEAEESQEKLLRLN